MTGEEAPLDQQIERKLSPAVSRGTMAAVLDYLAAFGTGSGAIHDDGEGAFIRLRSARDLRLIEHQFPGLISANDAPSPLPDAL